MGTQDRAAVSRGRYKHASLLDPRKQIRVFLLHPAKSFHTELQGHLEIHSETDTSYEAVSYTWGTESNSEDLILDDHYFSIGLNLRDALRRLRLRRKVRRLWIDAICIDQGDNNEKTAQVAMMGTIYSKAQQTIIWLGEDSEDGEDKLAMGFFAKAARKMWYRQKAAKLESETRLVNNWMRKRMPKVSKQHHQTFLLAALHLAERKKGYQSVETTVLQQILQTYDSGFMEHVIRPFLQRAWFGRRWIIQEACLSQKAFMMCGVNTLKWTSFERVISATRHSNMWRGINQHASELLSVWKSFRWFWGDQKHGKKTLLHAARWLFFHMKSFDRFECQDPRDILGAVIDLRKPLASHFTVDYPRSTEANYRSFARTMINSGGMIDVLYSATQRPRLSEDDTIMLPSWVPDWRLPACAQFSMHSPRWASYAESELTSPPSRQRQYSFRMLEDGEEALVVRGVILDEIKKVLPASGFLSLGDTDAYTEKTGLGVALNIDRERLIPREGDVAWPLGSPRLHLVRPGDLVCTIAEDEQFLQGIAGKIMFGLFVLRQRQDQCLATSTYRLVAILNAFKPGEKATTQEAFRQDNFQEIVMV